jgi:hypothetical protein
MNQLKNLDIKNEINRLKILDECYASMDSDELETDSDELETDSDECST